MAESSEDEFASEMSTDEGELSDSEVSKHTVASLFEQLRRRLKEGTLHGVGRAHAVEPQVVHKPNPVCLFSVHLTPQASITHKVAEFGISATLPWVESLLVSSQLEADLDPQKDLKREDALYCV